MIPTFACMHKRSLSGIPWKTNKATWPACASWSWPWLEHPAVPAAIPAASERLTCVQYLSGDISQRGTSRERHRHFQLVTHQADHMRSEEHTSELQSQF